jgi:hypothetical protein
MASSASRRAAQRRNAKAVRSGRSLIADIGKFFRSSKARGPTFHTLEGALKYAAQLPDNQASHIIGRGQHRYSSNRYTEGDKGWASLSEWALPGYYDISYDDILDEDQRQFLDGADTFRVVLYG